MMAESEAQPKEVSHVKKPRKKPKNPPLRYQASKNLLIEESSRVLRSSIYGPREYPQEVLDIVPPDVPEGWERKRKVNVVEEGQPEGQETQVSEERKGGQEMKKERWDDGQEVDEEMENPCEDGKEMKIHVEKSFKNGGKDEYHKTVDEIKEEEEEEELNVISSKRFDNSKKLVPFDEGLNQLKKFKVPEDEDKNLKSLQDHDDRDNFDLFSLKLRHRKVQKLPEALITRSRRKKNQSFDSFISMDESESLKIFEPEYNMDRKIESKSAENVVNKKMADNDLVEEGTFISLRHRKIPRNMNSQVYSMIEVKGDEAIPLDMKLKPKKSIGEIILAPLKEIVEEEIEDRSNINRNSINLENFMREESEGKELFKDLVQVQESKLVDEVEKTEIQEENTEEKVNEEREDKSKRIKKNHKRVNDEEMILVDNETTLSKKRKIISKLAQKKKDIQTKRNLREERKVAKEEAEIANRPEKALLDLITGVVKGRIKEMGAIMMGLRTEFTQRWDEEEVREEKNKRNMNKILKKYRDKRSDAAKKRKEDLAQLKMEKDKRKLAELAGEIVAEHEQDEDGSKDSESESENEDVGIVEENSDGEDEAFDNDEDKEEGKEEESMAEDIEMDNEEEEKEGIEQS